MYDLLMNLYIIFKCLWYIGLFINNFLRMFFKLFKDVDFVDNVVWDWSKNN